ncbi:unnamed protein product [Durusdinium trenchii]
MQTYHAVADPGKPGSSVDADLLDRLVLKDPGPKDKRSSYAMMAHSALIFNRTRDGNQTGNATAVEGFFRKAKSFVTSRPEVVALIKALMFSFALASLLGGVAICLGVARLYPPYKYLSWRDIHEVEGFRISSLLSFWASLSATTKATLTTTMIIFTATFLLMLKLHIIQPVINQLTCYVYVFVVFGTVTAVIISDLTSQALKTFKDQLQPLHKLREQLHRIQNRLLLGGEEDEAQLAND